MDNKLAKGEVKIKKNIPWETTISNPNDEEEVEDSAMLNVECGCVPEDSHYMNGTTLLIVKGSEESYVLHCMRNPANRPVPKTVLEILQHLQDRCKMKQTHLELMKRTQKCRCFCEATHPGGIRTGHRDGSFPRVRQRWVKEPGTSSAGHLPRRWTGLQHGRNGKVFEVHRRRP